MEGSRFDGAFECDRYSDFGCVPRIGSDVGLLYFWCGKFHTLSCVDCRLFNRPSVGNYDHIYSDMSYRICYRTAWKWYSTESILFTIGRRNKLSSTIYTLKSLRRCDSVGYCIWGVIRAKYVRDVGFDLRCVNTFLGGRAYKSIHQ